MKRVDRWESVDGQVFDSPEMCEFHEKRVSFCERLDNELYLIDVTSGEIADWLEANKDTVINYLNGLVK